MVLLFALYNKKDNPVGGRIEELRENFAECDQNSDGRIQFAEFENLLKNIGAETSPEENRVGFAEVDTDRDGTISFEEFVAWFSED